MPGPALGAAYVFGLPLHGGLVASANIPSYFGVLTLRAQKARLFSLPLLTYLMGTLNEVGVVNSQCTGCAISTLTIEIFQVVYVIPHKYPPSVFKERSQQRTLVASHVMAITR